ncbi:hypothetical protein KC957_02885, partial [Candidatus Saccharibacteria bacterium]|nr:hypothetical protein [Candidatus Saccharibacteria bacterium]
MADRQSHAEVARATVMGVVRDFHVSALLDSGVAVEVPVTYQIVEPGFRPFEQGKASPDAIQARFDEIVVAAGSRGVALGLESAESVRKLLTQEGLGIDCSNFAFRALQKLHDRLGLTEYEKTVTWQLEKV